MGGQTQKSTQPPLAFIGTPRFVRLPFMGNEVKAVEPLTPKLERNSVVTMSIASHGLSKEDTKFLRNENLYLSQHPKLAKDL